MKAIVCVLNENRKARVAGDVSFFSSVERMRDQLESIDVINGEYQAYTADGRPIKLQASSELGAVVCEIESEHDRSDELVTVLRSFLMNNRVASAYKIDQDIVCKAAGIGELLSLVPPQSIDEGV